MNQIIKTISESEDKGRLLELVVEDILNDGNFGNIKRQNSGSQFGFDLVAYKKGVEQECWKFECKNLKKSVGVKDISPKLIWHVNNTAIDRFVIITPTGISNEVQHLLEQESFSFPVEIWQGEYFEKLVAESPRALERLKITTPVSFNKNAVSVVFQPSKIKFKVAYNSGEPFSIDYFAIEKKLVKAYTEQEFKLIASITNPTKENIFIHGVNVITIDYKVHEGRTLRLFKQKGLIEPIKITFSPKNIPFGKVNTLPENKIIEVRPGSTEYINLKLGARMIAGFYEFIFELVYTIGSKTMKINSSVFSLNVASKNCDTLYLCVAGKYYDSPVETILNLEGDSWFMLKKRPSNSITYLGNTIFDVPEGIPSEDTWKIKEISGKRSKKGKSNEMIIERQTPKVIFDLNLPIKEKILTLKDIRGSR